MRECPHCGGKPLIVMAGACADCGHPIAAPQAQPTGKGYKAGWSYMQQQMDNPQPTARPTEPPRTRAPSSFRAGVAKTSGWVKAKVEHYSQEREELRRAPAPADSPAPEPLTAMTWQQAEVYACAWMMQNGFPDAMTTASGPDGGVDITARQAVAQVKNRAKPVGIEQVQRLQGIAGSTHRRALLFAANGVTIPALRWADTHGVACYSYPPVVRLYAPVP